MREESLRIARSAALDNAMFSACTPASSELAPVRCHQIEMNFRPEIAMSRRALVQEQQRIPDVNRVRVEHLFEQLIGVGELRLELRAHFGADGVAALANARTDRGTQIARSAAELAPHLAHTLLDHARDRSAPARVKRSHHPPLHVGHQHGHAIGGLDRQQQSRSVGDHAIAG